MKSLWKELLCDNDAVKEDETIRFKRIGSFGSAQEHQTMHCMLHDVRWEWRMDIASGVNTRVPFLALSAMGGGEPTHYWHIYDPAIRMLLHLGGDDPQGWMGVPITLIVCKVCVGHVTKYLLRPHALG